jgi:zinc protease
MNFYRQWYGPNNAVLMVNGPVDAALVRRLAEKHFGLIQARAAPARNIPAQIAPTRGARLMTKSASAQESLWRRDYLAPSYTAGAAEHVYALQVLAEILGGGPESRLHALLVEGAKLATAITIDYDPESIDLSIFSVLVLAKRAADFDEIARITEAELRALSVGHLPSPSLPHAKQDLKAKMAATIDKVPPSARVVGEALMRGRTIQQAQEWPDRIDAVTTDDITMASQKLVSSWTFLTGVMLAQPRRGVAKLALAYSDETR